MVVMAFDETLNNGGTAFPCMSRRHSHESRSLHGTRVLKEDEIIWESAAKVWNYLPRSKIANAFVLAKWNSTENRGNQGGGINP